MSPKSKGGPYQVEFTSTATTPVPFLSTSEILRADPYNDNSKPHKIASGALETYGNPCAPDVLRLGNGGLGPTGLLRTLCETYLADQRLVDRLRIQWVCNHSRHTQVALQAGVVDIGLTYERQEEARAEVEGWSSTVGILCHDHFVLAGPSNNPAGLGGSECIGCALHTVAIKHATFHTRGDGSATMHKEHHLWDIAGVTPTQRNNSAWYKRRPCTPLEALARADTNRAYLITDRATFLLAQHKGEIKDMVVYVEGGAQLMNSCAVVLRSDESREPVWNLVNWLMGDTAQDVIRTFGEIWATSVPIVTPRNQDEVSQYGKCTSSLSVNGGSTSTPALAHFFRQLKFAPSCP